MRENLGVTLPPMPWAMFAVAALAGAIGGAVFGFIRGLSYLPTLPFAIVEGGFLFGVPAAFFGLLLVGAWALASALRRHRLSYGERHDDLKNPRCSG